jgi:hypothetical protein
MIKALLIIVLICALCLLGGTTAGYVLGSHVLSPDSALTPIIANTRIEQLGGNGDRFVLNYVCKGKVLASFDIDSNKVISAKPAASEIISRIRERAKKGKETEYQRLYDTTVAFFVGGGVAARFGKPLLTAMKSRDNSRYTVSGIIAGISGFYLGFSLAAARGIPCDDYEPVLLAQEPEVWKVIEHSLASLHYLETLGRSIAGSRTINDDELKKISTDIENGAITSEIFRKLSPNFTPPISNSESLFSFDRVVAVYIPVVILFSFAVLAAILIGRYVDGQVKARKARNEAKQSAASLNAALRPKRRSRPQRSPQAHDAEQ